MKSPKLKAWTFALTQVDKRDDDHVWWILAQLYPVVYYNLFFFFSAGIIFLYKCPNHDFILIFAYQLTWKTLTVVTNK